jgi:hypothetical protein
MHIAISYHSHGHHKKEQVRLWNKVKHHLKAIRTSQTLEQSQTSFKSNSVAKRPSIGCKDLHRHDLKHTTPLNNVWLLVLFLQQRPKTDPMGPSEDNQHRSDNLSIVKNHVIST